jgi:hypothetical protein
MEVLHKCTQIEVIQMEVTQRTLHIFAQITLHKWRLSLFTQMDTGEVAQMEVALRYRGCYTNGRHTFLHRGLYTDGCYTKVVSYKRMLHIWRSSTYDDEAMIEGVPGSLPVSFGSFTLTLSLHVPFTSAYPYPYGMLALTFTLTFTNTPNLRRTIPEFEAYNYPEFEAYDAGMFGGVGRTYTSSRMLSLEASQP